MRPKLEETTPLKVLPHVREAHLTPNNFLQVEFLAQWMNLVFWASVPAYWGLSVLDFPFLFLCPYLPSTPFANIWFYVNFIDLEP